MKRKAFEQLIRVLSSEKLPEGVSKFDMTSWKCGTAACAIGCAASDSWFIKAGFTLSPPIRLLTEKNCYFKPVYRRKSGMQYYGWEAVLSFFNINGGEANYLFRGDAYPENVTKKQVIDRIRHFITTGCMQPSK